jgi:hypothetical protein
MYDLNEYEIQLLSDTNRLYRHLQLSTYEVQWQVKHLEKIIRSVQRCLDNRIEEQNDL